MHVIIFFIETDPVLFGHQTDRRYNSLLIHHAASRIQSISCTIIMLAALIIFLLEVCHKTMAILEILEFPDPRLRTIAKPVTSVDDRIKNLINDMFDTMYDAPGVGLAASQINVHERIVVIDVSEDKSQPLVFINPEVTVLDSDLHEYDEGCLSVPGLRGKVPRFARIRYTGFDPYGDPIDRTAEGFHARVVQHECDHLIGVLYPMRVRDFSRFGYTDVLFPGLDDADD